MTLIVSDISTYGIIMVGDSAVTRRGAGAVTYHGGCQKVQYSKEARLGFSIWGKADVGLQRMDQWLAEFIQKYVKAGTDVESVGNRLTDELNAALAKTDKAYFKRGIHLAGFKGTIPVLYHIHSGHNHEQPHEMRFYHDFPDDARVSLEDHGLNINSGGWAQLKNGRHQHFNVLFQQVLEYSQNLRHILKTEFPPPDLKGRLEYYKMLVRFIASVLELSNQDRSVNDKLSWVAFDSHGTLLEEKVALAVVDKVAGGSLEF